MTGWLIGSGGAANRGISLRNIVQSEMRSKGGGDGGLRSARQSSRPSEIVHAGLVFAALRLNQLPPGKNGGARYPDGIADGIENSGQLKVPVNQLLRRAATYLICTMVWSSLRSIRTHS